MILLPSGDPACWGMIYLPLLPPPEWGRGLEQPSRLQISRAERAELLKGLSLEISPLAQVDAK